MTDENDLRAATTADNGVAPQTNAPRDSVLDRRGFLRKSASVAGSISAPALIGGGVLAFSHSVIAGTTKSNRMYAEDDKAFFDETLNHAGLGDWDYAEASWQVNSEAGGDNAQELVGRLYLMKTYQFIYWTITKVASAYDFRIHTKEQAHGTGLSGAQDLDSTKDQYIALVSQNSIAPTPLPDTAAKFDGSELRRRLQYDEDWGDNWLIPRSWVSEFQQWFNEEHIETGLPLFGVLIHQWGSRATAVAMRVIYVYRYDYRFVLGAWMRRATRRRTMYLFGGNIRGRWGNLAIDEIDPLMRGALREVARAIYLAAQIDNPVDIRMDRMPEPFDGWRNNIVGQDNSRIAAVFAMLAQLVGGVNVARPIFRANQQAMRALGFLMNDWPPLNDGDYPVIDAPNLPGPYPERVRGVQWSNRGDRAWMQLVMGDMHLRRNFWLAEAPPRLVGWQRLSPEDIDRGLENNDNPALLAQRRWPAVFPGQPNQPNNGNTSTETTDEDSVVSFIEADLDGFPRNPADGSINTILSVL